MLDPLPFARLCAAAYERPPEIAIGPARAILELTDDGLVIAFRGTCDGETAACDVEALPWPVPGLGAIHLGFWEAVQSVWPSLADAMGMVRVPVLLTGHSLGGALAILTAVKMILAGKVPAAVVTFGAPRVSIGGEVGQVFAKSGCTPVLYRHGADCVPMLPPADFGWVHPAPLLTIGPPRECPVASIEDHAIARYCAALAEEGIMA